MQRDMREWVENERLKLRNIRKCLICGYEGDMKTWLSNYGGAMFIAFLLLLFYLIPGLIFIAWGWGKFKCPQCGALAKNIQVEKS